MTDVNEFDPLRDRVWLSARSVSHSRQKAKSPLVTSRAPEEGTPSMRHQDGQGSVRQDVLGCSAE